MLLRLAVWGLVARRPARRPLLHCRVEGQMRRPGPGAGEEKQT